MKKEMIKKISEYAMPITCYIMLPILVIVVFALAVSTSFASFETVLFIWKISVVLMLITLIFITIDAIFAYALDMQEE